MTRARCSCGWKDESSVWSRGRSGGCSGAFVSMLLAIDVGNTNIVVGVFDGATLIVSWRLLTLRERTADEVGLMVVGLFGHDRIELNRIDAAVMASVVPPLTPIMRSMVKRYFNREPLVVDPT